MILEPLISVFFNRPGVARAVLKTALTLTDSFIHSLIDTFPPILLSTATYKIKQPQHFRKPYICGLPYKL